MFCQWRVVFTPHAELKIDSSVYVALHHHHHRHADWLMDDALLHLYLLSLYYFISRHVSCREKEAAGYKRLMIVYIMMWCLCVYRISKTRSWRLIFGWSRWVVDFLCLFFNKMGKNFAPQHGKGNHHLEGVTYLQWRGSRGWSPIFGKLVSIEGKFN